MSCEHLICARCAGPVIEGRCPVCRAGREKVHGQGGVGLVPTLMVLALLVLLLSTVMLNHFVGG